MKVLNLLLAVMFLLFASVQLNDPDPVTWILIYGTLAVLCILAAFGHYYPRVLIVLIIVYVAYSMIDIPSITRWLKSDNKSMLFDNIAKMQNLYIEESREFLGLMICVVVMIMHYVRARMIKSRI
jgi:MFS superfamily sulfate permease-like transporter